MLRWVILETRAIGLEEVHPFALRKTLTDLTKPDLELQAVGMGRRRLYSRNKPNA